MRKDVSCSCLMLNCVVFMMRSVLHLHLRSLTCNLSVQPEWHPEPALYIITTHTNESRTRLENELEIKLQINVVIYSRYSVKV